MKTILSIFNRFLIFPIVITLLLLACTGRKDHSASTENTYRPVIHFTPPSNWTNDPNGLVYYSGEYHLFYQHNPYENHWGHMTWAHAVSRDLYTWENLPNAIPERDSTMIYSGSAVIDKNNTSKLCPPGSGDCMVAMYTAQVGNSLENQCIAWSADSGRTWQQYKRNPVIDLGKRDFRDPNLFRYDNAWRVAVSVPPEHKILFYKSPDLVHWQLTGEFGNAGDTSKIWECPDITRVPIAGSDSSVWVLFISSGSPYGDNFTGMQYFIGDFDGKAFRETVKQAMPQWLDYGKDFYAAITYNNLPDSRPVMIGWDNNWVYANDLPLKDYKGMMSVPRSLSIMRLNDRLFVAQQPVKIPDSFLEENAYEINEVTLNKGESDIDQINGQALIIDAELINQSAQKYGLKIFKSEKYATIVGIDTGKKQFYIDRRNSGKVNFNKEFPSIETAPFKQYSDHINLRLIADHSVITLFAEQGTTIMTEQVFPVDRSTGISLFAEGGSAVFKRVRITKINPGE